MDASKPSRQVNRQLGLCACGSPPAPGYKSCERCHRTQAKVSATYRTAHREQIRQADKARYATLPDAQYETLKVKVRDTARRIRQAVIQHFGGKCARCGFADWRALQVDHIHGGGSRERRKQVNATYYRKMLKETPGVRLQLLCANCNQIKRYEKSEN